MSATPVISVIIPCYNHGHFLPKALESVLSQNYPAVEVVVVDDGSTDTTRQVTARYPQVCYHYQPNQGLSAARNAGIRCSSGQYLVFLDADDWLYPGALQINARYLQQHQHAAFVSGAFDAIHVNENLIKEYSQEVNSDHYCKLLSTGNYIGMIAAVMFRRWVLNEFFYDESLKSCEDYDLYLRIARKYPIVHHTEKIAAYRIHSANMSSNIPFMLETVLAVLRRQKKYLKTNAEKQALASGQRFLINLYMGYQTQNLRSKKAPATAKDLHMLLKYNPPLYFRYLMATQKRSIKSKISFYTPDPLKKVIKIIALKKPGTPVKKVALGDLDRTTPLSTYFGYDRGGPIDRYYIENFLRQEAASIKGRTLEIGDNTYSLRYGGENITQSDILHVDDSNKQATFIGDISNAPQLPDNTFDCIILTQTLHLIYDFKGALQTCHRILKPGGTLLLTVPGITPIDHDEWQDTWYWSFTDKSLVRLMQDTFPNGSSEVQSYGNVLVAASFLYGLGVPEISKEKLDYHDPHFQVIISVKAVK